MPGYPITPQNDAIVRRFVASLNAFHPRIRRIVLFGSRARGDEKPWSDYDLLVPVDRRDQSLVDGIYDAVVQIQADTGCDLSLKIMSEKARSGFVAKVVKEGIVLG